MTKLEEALGRQRAIERSQRQFQAEIVRLIADDAELKRREKEIRRSAELMEAQFKQYAGQENCCPYGEG